MLRGLNNNVVKKEWLLNAFFFLFIAIIIANRVWLFFTINIDCIDNDQPIMWLGAKHYSYGLFYEPRFYGQDYNTMMEALFAVPFIKIGLPVYYAVPIATHLIFLTPFLLTSVYLFRRNHKEKALFVLGTLLCMPVGYDIMNSIPRGFVTGLFFTSLLIISVIHPKNNWYVLVNTFLAYVGFLVNQNSVLVTAPLLFYLFLINYKELKYYIYTLAGILAALPVDYLLNHFYKVHPEYVFYPANNTFSITYFCDAIKHLDQRFAHISFFIEEKSFLLLLIFILMTAYLYLKNKALFFSFLVFFLVMITSFFSSKVSDGIVWPFYSYSRMYLGIPVIFYLILLASPLNFKKAAMFFVPLVLAFTVYKELNFRNSIAYHRQEKMWGHVHLNTLQEIIDAVDAIKQMCKEQDAKDFIIINSTWHDDEINYGVPALSDDFPNTFKPSFERRTWRINEEKNAVHEKFIIYTANTDFDRIAKEKYKLLNVTRLNDYGFFLIKGNKLTTSLFLKYINATTAGF